MLHKYPLLFNDPKISYPHLDADLNFAEYITLSKKIIAETRQDLKKNSQKIIDANAPFELLPTNKSTYGVILIHGLLDSCFVMKDIGMRLQTQGLQVRSILLPGHGTVPGALLSVDYEEWLQTVRYGISSLAKEVDHIFLIGFSTGAIAAIHETLLNDEKIAGIIAFAPAFKIKSSLACISNWPLYLSSIWKRSGWLEVEEELDYAKYSSLPINAVYQVYALTEETKGLVSTNKLTPPLFVITTHDDEIISSAAACEYFKTNHNPQSRLLYYSNKSNDFHDDRVVVRRSAYPDENILNFSHICLPISPDNFHYGKDGDYIYASHVLKDKDCLYYALNKSRVKLYRKLLKSDLIKKQRCRLSFNPDFDFMMQEINSFISSIKTSHLQTA